MRATDTPDGDRRPDLQHLSFQFRDIPRRHPVDPRRPVERRARPWHVQQPDDGAHYPSAGDHARAAVSGIDSGLAGQGHLAGRDHLGAETVLRVAEARAESYRNLEVLTAVTVIYWLLGYPRQTRRLDSSTLEGCGMTILQIGLAVGYQSESGFVRAFKRELGMPPARYRKFVTEKSSEQDDKKG